jgi:serine protease Do
MRELSRPRHRMIAAALCLAAALAPAAQAAEGGAASAPFWTEAPGGPADARPGSFSALAETLLPAVVNIRVTRSLEAQGRAPHELPPASASGFVVSADGYIVTNNHVVAEAGELQVAFLDGTELEARIIGRDPDTDLALIKVDSPRPLAVAPLGDSDLARVGDWVVAIGNPLGLAHSVTVGILSAKGRRENGRYDDYLQTDASINPGNSGGPLIDTLGRVVGINTMIRVYEQSATGIAFSIPINMVKPLIAQLHRQGRVTRGYLGIQFQPLTQALARGFQLDSTLGALVGDVLPNTPAERASLRSGDVIVEFDGRKIGSAEELPRSVAAVAPGTPVDMVVVRSGQQTRLRAVVGSPPESETAALQIEQSPAPRSKPANGWGFEVDELETGLASSEGSAGAAPLIVTKVEPDSAASRAGLRPDDLILKLNGVEVHTAEELRERLESEAYPVLQTRRSGSNVYRALERE